MGRVKFSSVIAGFGVALALAGCGGGGNGGPDTGRLTLAITDAPVDDATEVVVEFTGVEIKPQDGEAIDIDFDTPRQIDLLALNGGLAEALINNELVAAGPYNWVRLKVNAERGVIDSFISFEDGSMHSLFVPSGAQTGLKLVSGFVVPAGGLGSYTIDFDLRKSVHYPPGLGDDYVLRPALRLLDDTRVGTLEGTVDVALLEDPSCTSGNAVYVFEGDVEPDDVDGDGDPVTSALVELDEGSGEFVYRVGFLLEGQYTVALTCQADDDDPELEDTEFAFLATALVDIVADEVTVQDF